MIDRRLGDKPVHFEISMGKDCMVLMMIIILIKFVILKKDLTHPVELIQMLLFLKLKCFVSSSVSASICDFKVSLIYHA